MSLIPTPSFLPRVREASQQTKRRSSLRAVSRLIYTSIGVIVLGLIICTTIAERHETNQEDIFHLAVISLSISVLAIPYLGVLQLRWWLLMRTLRKQAIASHPPTEKQQTYTRMRQSLAYLPLSGGWLLIAFFGFGSAILFQQSGHDDIAQMVYEGGGWSLLFFAGILFVQGVLFLSSVINGGFDALQRAREPLIPGSELRPGGLLLRGFGWFASITCGGLTLLSTLNGIGVWHFSDAVTLGLLIGIPIFLLSGTLVGWWYDRQENREALDTKPSYKE